MYLFKYSYNTVLTKFLCKSIYHLEHVPFRTPSPTTAEPRQKKHSFLMVKFGCGPLPVTGENEGLGWDPLLKM